MGSFAVVCLLKRVFSVFWFVGLQREWEEGLSEHVSAQLRLALFQ